jgi:hypothetical protein
MGWEANSQEASTGVVTFTLRGLLSTAAWVHPSLAHGKNVDFVNGGITSQQEDTMDSIEAEVAGASGRGIGRRLLF